MSIEVREIRVSLPVPYARSAKKARAVARQQGVRVTGSLAVLFHAEQSRIIPAIRPPLEMLVASGYRISWHYAQLTLNAAGEQE